MAETRFRFLVVLLLFLVAAPVPAIAEETLTVGMLAYRPKALLETRWQPLVDYLDQALPDHRLKLRLLSQGEFDTALLRGDIDFVFTNPNHFIALREHNALSGALATLVSLESGTPTASLGGVIIRRKERSELRQLSDLSGKTIASNGINYLGGYLAQAAELSQAGVPMDRLQMRFTGQPHDRVIDAVLAGQVDAGFIRSGVLEQMRQEGNHAIDALDLIAPRQIAGFPYALSTRLYPEWPFVALPRVDPQATRRITAALLALEPEHPVSRAAGIHGFTVPADYAPVEQAMRDLRLAPYDRTPDFTLGDIWEQHRSLILLGTLAGTAILLLLLRLSLGNRRLAEARRETQRYADKLEQERGHLLTLVRTLPDLVWLRDGNGVYLSCNPRFERFFGAPETDIVGKTDYDFVDRAMADVFRDNDRTAIATRSPVVNEIEVTFADGHRELLEITQTPMYGPQGHLIGVLGIGHDITERKQLDDALREATLFLRESQSIARLGGWKADPMSGRVIWTEEAYRLLDRPLTPPLSDLEAALQHHAPESQPLLREQLLRAWRDDTPFTLETEMVTWGGRRFWAEFRCIGRVEYGDGSYLTGTFQDISARKRAEDLQRYSVFQAGIAEMSVSLLHNIGNAVTSMVADTNAITRASTDLARVAGLLQRNCADFEHKVGPEGLNAGLARHLLAVQRQAAYAIERLHRDELAERSQRINASVGHIADIVRIQQSAAIPTATAAPFDLGQVVRDALAMQADNLDKYGIRHQVDIAADLGPITLSRNRLLQALVNVIKNAFEAIRERQGEADYVGHIDIRAEALPGARFRLRVSDNGSGIETDQQSHVFRFGYSTKARGSGFGLHGTALFVQEQNGEIHLTSDGRGQGATLEMILPTGNAVPDPDANQ